MKNLFIEQFTKLKKLYCSKLKLIFNKSYSKSNNYNLIKMLDNI
jgi:hypothetical protein